MLPSTHGRIHVRTESGACATSAIGRIAQNLEEAFGLSRDDGMYLSAKRTRRKGFGCRSRCQVIRLACLDARRHQHLSHRQCDRFATRSGQAMVDEGIKFSNPLGVQVGIYPCATTVSEQAALTRHTR